jgi:thiol-disulfide isomerase/thioredoxin
MQLMESIFDIENWIKSNDMVLLYFSGTNCGVCRVIKPQVIELLKKYPKIKSAEIELENHPEIAAQYNVFTLPSIIVFIDGKETIRKLRYMSLVDLESNFSRYYDLYYKE